MRIAVPVYGEDISPSLGESEAVRLYEDDHGKIVRQTSEPTDCGFDALLALLERRGADVLLCAAPAPEEKRALAEAGLLLSTGASGNADAAVRAYLNAAIACDPNNTCNYCGHRDECALPHKSV